MSRWRWNQFLSNLVYRCKLHRVALQPFLIHRNDLKLNLKFILRMGDFVTSFNATEPQSMCANWMSFELWTIFICSLQMFYAHARDKNRFKFNEHNFVFIKCVFILGSNCTEDFHKIVQIYVPLNGCFCIFKLKILFI